MDLVRPRAIPALIAALALPCAAADCASLDGTYRYKSTGSGEPISLSVLTLSRERTKLFRVDEKGTGPSSLAAGEPMQRRKVTPLAQAATLIHTAKDTRLRFLDASGKALAEMTINDTGRWSCKGGHLERTKERTAGLGDAIRTERVVETLERDAKGDLVLRTTLTVVDAPVKPRVTEARFPAAR